MVVKEEKGRLSLDMLIGLSIFLFSFIFIGQFLPSVFADTRSEISVFSEAYKVSVLLVEDPGRWINLDSPDEKGFHWENEWYKNNISYRPGLARVGRPGFICLQKLVEFKNATFTNQMTYEDDSWVRDVFGLNTPDRTYHVNITLLKPQSTAYSPYYSKDKYGNVVLAIGPPIPNKKVSRYERVINLPAASDFLNVTKTNPSNENYEVNTTFPLGGALIVIRESINPSAACWVQIKVELENTTSNNILFETIYDLNLTTCNDPSIFGIYPLTSQLNEAYEDLYEEFIDTYNEIPDTNEITLRIKNLNCSVGLSQVGEILGDFEMDIEARIVAKLVVTVWEG
jgi:hypothetical protein